MKGMKKMDCEHKRIKSVNCEKFCLDCGAKLPDDFIASVKAENPANNPPVDNGKGKATTRKRTAKNG